MDPIAAMINSIKNAGNAGMDKVNVPYSKIKENIAEVLAKEGFIKSFEKRMEGGKSVLSMGLHLENRIPKIRGVKRLSKQSKRIYKKSTEIRQVKSGYGLLILSTPKGIMTGKEAKRESVGGEALFTIW